MPDLTPETPQMRVRRLLDRIIDGWPIVALGESWDEVCAGNVVFRCLDGTWLTVFNDCDCFDYIDRVEWPDGTITDYGDLYPDGGNLWEPDREALERRLKAATVEAL